MTDHYFSNANAGPDLCCLVVEDNPFALDIMKIFLERQGLHIEAAENGREAVDMYRANPRRYLIIFMDLQMPIMGGYEAARKIRESGLPNAGSIPIVAMSGDPLDRLSELGFTQQLRKPFTLQAVTEVLERLLPSAKMDERS